MTNYQLGMSRMLKMFILMQLEQNCCYQVLVFNVYILFSVDKSVHETNNDIHGISISSLQLTVYALHRKTLISTIKFTPRSNVLIIR